MNSQKPTSQITNFSIPDSIAGYARSHLLSVTILVNFLLGNCVSIGYTRPMSGKDSGFRIRVERPLHEQFLQVCRSHDRPASQVLREFMRDYVARDAEKVERTSEGKSAEPANK